MREAGELVPATGLPSRVRTAGVAALSDLIEAMREAGELAPVTGVAGPGRGKAVRSVDGFLVLSDLISSRPRQRASEWASLAMLTQAEIDDCERRANRRP
jgi:hypothetical protein